MLVCGKIPAESGKISDLLWKDFFSEQPIAEKKIVCIYVN